jgi:hypothetical protein
VYAVDLHVTVNNRKTLCVAHKCFLRRIYADGKRRNPAQQVQFSILTKSIKFCHRFSWKCHISNFMEICPAEATLTHADRGKDRRTRWREQALTATMRMRLQSYEIRKEIIIFRELLNHGWRIGLTNIHRGWEKKNICTNFWRGNLLEDATWKTTKESKKKKKLAETDVEIANRYGAIPMTSFRFLCWSSVYISCELHLLASCAARLIVQNFVISSVILYWPIQRLDIKAQTFTS